MAATIIWHRAKYQAMLFSHLRRRIQVAGHYFQNKVKSNISTFVVFDNNDKAERSKPGEYPRMETGELHDNINLAFSGDGLGFSVSIGVKHGVILETSRKLRRQFLRRTLNEEKNNLVSMLTHGASGIKVTFS